MPTLGDADPFGTGPFQSLLHSLGLPSGGDGAEWRRVIGGARGAGCRW
jgi:hypothetical protein